MVEVTNKAAACVKGSKSVGKSVYNDSRWTLMPNMDLCQFYDSGLNNVLFKVILIKIIKIIFSEVFNKQIYTNQA